MAGKNKGSSPLDLFVINEDGQWVGLRLNKKYLYGFLSLLIAALFISILGLLGWWTSVYKLNVIDRDLVKAKLQLQAKNQLLTDSQSKPKVEIQDQVSSINALSNSIEIKSSWLKIVNMKNGFNVGKKTLDISFQLLNTENNSRSWSQLFAFFTFNNNQHWQVYPKIGNAVGLDVLFAEGKQIRYFRNKRYLKYSFATPISWQVEAEINPVNLTMVVFDEKGNIVTRKTFQSEIKGYKK